MRTFVFQRRRVSEQTAANVHVLPTCLLDLNEQVVSPAQAPWALIRAGRSPSRLSWGEQALPSVAHTPAKGSSDGDEDGFVRRLPVFDSAVGADGRAGLSSELAKGLALGDVGLCGIALGGVALGGVALVGGRPAVRS